MESILQFFFANKEAIFIIALTIFLGLEVISNVPSVLHTPLMSGANAISGVIIIGGIILVGHADLAKSYPRIQPVELNIGNIRIAVWHTQCNRRICGHRPHA